MGSESKVKEPEYVSPDGKFKFTPLPNDGPDGYFVTISGRDNFIISSRSLGDLTNPRHPTETAMRSLEAMCGPQINLILRDNGITQEQLHIALLQLQVYRQEEELTRAISMIRY